MQRRHALDVQFVDHRVVPRRARPAGSPLPVETVVASTTPSGAYGRAVGRSSARRRRRARARTRTATGATRRPANRARVRIEQDLGRIEPVAIAPDPTGRRPDSHRAARAAHQADRRATRDRCARVSGTLARSDLGASRRRTGRGARRSRARRTARSSRPRRPTSRRVETVSLATPACGDIVLISRFGDSRELEISRLVSSWPS